MPDMAEQNGKFVVYKSSAGSGKTFTLVREYLKIVLQNPDQFRQVLAITFTNKAANEMKERVVRNLIFLTDPANNRQEDAIKHLLPQLAKQLNLTEPQISLRASIVLRLIMHHYAEFAISTIDSFTHRVIRTFAHDLKIPMNFEVELDAETMLSQSVDLLISQVGSDEQLTRVMIDFVEKKAGDELSWQIEKDLNEFGSTLLSESSISALGEIRGYDLETFMKVRNNLIQWKSTWENIIKKLAVEAVALINREQIGADSFTGKSKSLLAYLQNLAQGKFDKIKPTGYALKSLESGEWVSLKAPARDRMAFNGIATELLKLGKSLLEMTENELPRYSLCRLLLNQLFSTALLSEIEKTLNALCQENNKLLISEFNRRIAQVVKEQPAPFIYERLGEKYHHYLIDEFQDTSILQWHNLLPLIENSLASSRINLVVGDAKQAIYRWRSGDAEQFGLLPRLLKDKPDPLLDSRERALINHYKEENLGRNHRSSPVIVDFNNRLFACIAPFLPERYGEVFKHATQEAAKKDKPGMVRVERIVKGEDDERNYEDIVHDKILTIIHELEADNFLLKDMAILCRENKKAAKIASFLIRNGIPVISSESLLLTQSEQVNFLVAWMKHLVDRTDGIQMAHILRYIIDKGLMTGVRLEDFFSKDDQQLSEGFSEIITGHFPFIDINRLKSLEIFGLTQYLILHFKLNRLNDSYMRFFQDIVLEFVKDHRGGLPEFLEWWEEKSLKASVVIPEGINAVRIMTIHKAKGLQFPAVIFPHADEQVRATRKNLWVPLDEDFARPLKTAYLLTQKSMKETIYEALYDDEIDRSIVDMVNVLYVALTRPEERLYVLTKDFPEKSDGAISVPKLLSQFFQSEGTWSPGRDLYQYGERWQRAEPGEKETREDVSAEEPSVCGASLKMLLRRHAPMAWDMDEPGKNREWGNLVHLAMSMTSRADQVGIVLQELLISGLITSEQQNELSVLMAGILRNPEISCFFDPAFEVRNEPEILTLDGRLYRPDRILMQRERVTIIDYKTGKHRAEYLDQVLKYAGLLNEMNYKVDGAYLLYLNRQPEVVKVI
ncbi:MAG: UvrD-helicase domain-containing protein [Bacteroidales bacterium]|nr:UvrD-helicase domain-containing protein [Bacteroidales bacterium]